MELISRTFLTLLLIALTFSFTTFNNANSGGLNLPLSETDANVYQLYSFFDLRNRESFIQVTNPEGARTVHVQIFDVSNHCTENNFFDDYTPNDTHVYNMRNIETNDGDPSGVDLAAGAYGFVVVTAVLGEGQPADLDGEIIGNFRVLDASGYEYRSNSQNGTLLDELSGNQLTFNYSSAGGINESDVIGITVKDIESGEVTAATGVTFDTNLYNNNEVPFSCSDTTFSCTANTFEYGINEALPSSRDGAVTCGSNNIDEGFVVLDRITSNDTEVFAGYVGLNTGGSSRGSMDSMWEESSLELLRLPDICSDEIDNNMNGLTDCQDLGCDGIIVRTNDEGEDLICEPEGEMTCDDMFDNDNNGLADCEEPICDGEVGGPMGQLCGMEDSTITCSDSFDNDADGLIDCADPGCGNEDFCDCEDRRFCRVFVTSTSHDGNIGGVSDANDICQIQADSAGLIGNFLAWISDSFGNSPDDNFNQVSVPYQLVDGTQIASNWTELTDGTIDSSINLNAMGGPPGSISDVWTGTNTNGTAHTENCDEWSDGTDSDVGIEGDFGSTDSNWTTTAGTELCNELNSLYCFEQ